MNEELKDFLSKKLSYENPAENLRTVQNEKLRQWADTNFTLFYVCTMIGWFAGGIAVASAFYGASINIIAGSMVASGAAIALYYFVAPPDITS